MKREVSNVISTMLASGLSGPWKNIMAFQMDGSGWDQSIDEMISLLEQERYVMYDINISADGLSLEVWFTTVNVG